MIFLLETEVCLCPHGNDNPACVTNLKIPFIPGLTPRQQLLPPLDPPSMPSSHSSFSCCRVRSCAVSFLLVLSLYVCTGAEASPRGPNNIPNGSSSSSSSSNSRLSAATSEDRFNSIVSRLAPSQVKVSFTTASCHEVTKPVTANTGGLQAAKHSWSWL